VAIEERTIAENIENELSNLGRHTYLYEAKAGDDASAIIRHLNDAGIIVLYVPSDGKAVDIPEVWKPEEGMDISAIVSAIKKKTSFTAGISEGGEYI
jgi:sulfate adenylyltransferase subunit 1